MQTRPRAALQVEAAPSQMTHTYYNDLHSRHGQPSINSHKPNQTWGYVAVIMQRGRTSIRTFVCLCIFCFWFFCFKLAKGLQNKKNFQFSSQFWQSCCIPSEMLFGLFMRLWVGVLLPTCFLVVGGGGGANSLKNAALDFISWSFLPNLSHLWFTASPGCVLFPVRGARCHYPASGLCTAAPSGPQHPQGDMELVLQDTLTLCLTSYSFLASKHSRAPVQSDALQSTTHSTAINVVVPDMGWTALHRVHE